MNVLTSSEIRTLFLQFFKEKGHEVRPSASLIPVNDPSLLWINSGVATLKKLFDGTETPDNPRITNSQKCIRTNDIENVGVTARHHTLFEMLGNFSIGDYFKEEAIAYAWEFLTSPEWLGFEPEKLYVTYSPDDLVTKEIWERQENFDPTHLVAEEGNFWDIGSGPCGPNTEIFYDRGEQYNDVAEDDPENYPGGENERWLEVWNLVFSEFNHMPDDTYEPLPHKNVDTGMGLERLVSIIQETPTNFETDLFMPIIKEIEDLSGVDYTATADQQVSFKVIADHIRAIAFAISDGALPSNEGRGYILRRLLRRSVMHGRRLGIKTTFLYKLVPVVASVMGDYYAELKEKVAFVQDVIVGEEERFHETIEGGEQQLIQIIEDLIEKAETVIPGDLAFKMYDTFGFPLELTQEEAREKGLTIDEEGFHHHMEEQRQRARQARGKDDSMAVQSAVLSDIHTDFDFLGYNVLTTNGTIKAIVLADEIVQQLPVGEEAWVFFNRSPFYAEAGGQIADHGGIYDGTEMIAEVLDVKKAPNGQHMHRVRALTMPLNSEQSYTLSVNDPERQKIEQNHTATHLLHRGLKNILGSHANQAGSYVGPDRLRFDFSHFGKMSEDEIKQVEHYVNYMIENGEAVTINEMPIDEAKALGAMALFGEKYGDIVRVVNIGNESIELCGGTHVGNTADIATFKIISEAGIGAGIRRIEALTGQAAIDYYREQEALLHDVQTQLNVKQTDQILHRIQQLQEELKAAQSEIETLNAQAVQAASAELLTDVKEVEGVTYIALNLPNESVDNMRNLGDIWRQKGVSQVLVLASGEGDKASLLVFVDEETSKGKLKAGNLIKPLAQRLKGGGGGRPTFAQAGGSDPAAIPSMLEAVPAEIEKQLSI